MKKSYDSSDSKHTLDPNSPFEHLLHYLELDHTKVTHLIDILHHTHGEEAKNIHQHKTPTEALDWLLRTTQNFWLRTSGKERWEIKDPEEWLKNKSVLINCLAQLGFTRSILPTRASYDHAILLSAVAPKFEKRLNFLEHLFQQGLTINNLYLVGGSRKLLPELEKSYIDLLGINATELDMLVHLTHEAAHRGSLPKNLNIVAVDTPIQKNEDGTHRRPNTEDTIHSWLEHHPQPGSVLCISCQPYVKYQGAIVKSVTKNDFFVDAVGAEIRTHEKISIILDSFARYIYTMNRISKGLN